MSPPVVVAAELRRRVAAIRSHVDDRVGRRAVAGIDGAGGFHAAFSSDAINVRSACRVGFGASIGNMWP